MKFFLFIKYYRMIEYSTLDEAYGISKKKKKDTIIQESLTDYTGKSDCYYKNKYNLELDTCENFDNKKKPCEPIQPPIYEIPADNETKKTLNETYNNLVNTKNNKIDNYDVKPYYNDEIDMYLNYNEENNKPSEKIHEPFISQTEPSPNVINDYELCNKLKSYKKYFNEIKPLPSQQSYTNNRDLLINLLLFIFIGIVIILLCDQIANLAINIGIKKTLEKMNITEI